MKTISAEELAALQEGAEVLASRRDQAKVFRRPDGRICKLVRSDLHWKASGPVRSARRFAHNVKRLTARGIPCPKVLELLHVKGTDRDVIVYEPLAGETMRDVLSRASQPGPLREQLARFIAQLHDLGIYFAAGHVGNYVLRPEGGFGLIDVHDLWISLGKLGAFHRARSFRILLKYSEDRALLGGETGLPDFLRAYLDEAALAPAGRRKFLKTLTAKLDAVGGSDVSIEVS